MTASRRESEILSQSVHESEPPVVDSRFPRCWDGRVAYVISQVGSPPVLGATAMALIAWTLASPRAWTWAGFYMVLSILVPLGYVVWLLRRGRITDLDVQLREQRARPMIVTIVCTALTGFVLALGHAPNPMIVVTGLFCLQMVTILVITLRWKISMHTATAAGVAALITPLVGTLLPLLIGVPIISWSRVRLRRHTLGQAVAGVALGLAFSIPGLWLMG